MAGFEAWSSGIGSDPTVNDSTTTALFLLLLFAAKNLYFLLCLQRITYHNWKVSKPQFGPKPRVQATRVAVIDSFIPSQLIVIVKVTQRWIYLIRST